MCFGLGPARGSNSEACLDHLTLMLQNFIHILSFTSSQSSSARLRSFSDLLTFPLAVTMVSPDMWALAGSSSLEQKGWDASHQHKCSEAGLCHRSKLQLMLQTPVFCYTAGKWKTLVLGVLYGFEELDTFSVPGRKFCTAKIPWVCGSHQTLPGSWGGSQPVFFGGVKLLGIAVLHGQHGMNCTWTWRCPASFLGWAGMVKG